MLLTARPPLFFYILCLSTLLHRIWAEHIEWDFLVVFMILLLLIVDDRPAGTNESKWIHPLGVFCAKDTQVRRTTNKKKNIISLWIPLWDIIQIAHHLLVLLLKVNEIKCHIWDGSARWWKGKFKLADGMAVLISGMRFCWTVMELMHGGLFDWFQYSREWKGEQSRSISF